MRYISHYAEYPIYEPAEGGYYYAGNQLVESERKSKRACKKNLEEIWEECKKENLQEYGMEEPDFDKDKYGNRIYPWKRSGNYIYKRSYLIGEGESFVIERKQGSQEHGWQPYC